MKAFRLGDFGKSAIAMLLVLLAPAAVSGASFKLQGQSKGCEGWVAGNLRHWQDLDYIPCRIRITGEAIKNRTLKITFPDQNSRRPGFENLLDFVTSDNVIITAAPTVSSPAAGLRTCAFTVDYNGKGEGSIRFFARLAAGAHRNPGSSLMLGGSPSSMGKLQIHRPAPSDGPLAFGINQRIDRGLMMGDSGFQVEFTSLPNRRYCIQYSSNLEAWKTAQRLIVGNGTWTQWIDRGPPETETHPATQAMRFYRAFLLPRNGEPCEKHGSKSCHQPSTCGDDDDDDDDDDDHDDDDDEDDDEDDEDDDDEEDDD